MMKQESKQNLAKSDFYAKILMKSMDFSEKKIALIFFKFFN